ncbi:MAG: FAD-dependent oxidoreductase [Pseudomonadota bacterium]
MSGAPHLSSDQIYDVAVVGAGVSGAYTAYRLMKDWRQSPALSSLVERRGGDNLKIGMFDTLDRVGGRLWSHRFEEAQDLVMELGGQGFTRLMNNVWGLATKELGLDVVPSPSFNQGLLKYMRGSRFTDAAFSDPQNFPSPNSEHLDYLIRYFVEDGEKASPGEVVMGKWFDAIPGMREAVGEISKMLCDRQAGDFDDVFPKITELLRLVRDARISSNIRPGAPAIWEYGFWNWMLEVVSNEAYKLNVDSAFTISFDRNYNLYDTIVGYLAVFFAYSDKTAFWTISDGYDQIPRKMVDAVCDAGGDLVQSTLLRGVEHGRADGEDLLMLDLHDLVSGRDSVVAARKVVLALPKAGLARLDRSSVMFRNPKFEEMLNAVNATPASKLYMLYDRAWWADAMPNGQVEFGYSTTDLPMKACYYISRSAKTQRALVLSSLTDAGNAQFWNRFGAEAVRTTAMQAINDGTANTLYAPPGMQAEVNAQLQQLHFDPGTGTVPPALDAVFQNWMSFPFEGGWHLWYPDVKSWEIMPAIRQPQQGVDLFICGEAYSALQGWVEGGINTAEKMLQDHFCLPKASWISKDYDVGP